MVPPLFYYINGIFIFFFFVLLFLLKQGMIPAFSESCAVVIAKWKKTISLGGTCEIDVWPEFQTLTGDIISRTAFGSNSVEGNQILQLQKELQKLVLEAMMTLYIPGFR